MKRRSDNFTKRNHWLEVVIEKWFQFLLGIVLAYPSFILLMCGFTWAEWLSVVLAFAGGALYCWILFWLES